MRELLKNRNFVLLFAGRVTTNIGDSLYWIGAMWLVYDLTGSSAFVGVAGFLIRFPTAVQFLFGPFVDRWNLKRIHVGTQLAQGVFVLLVPIAALLDVLSVWIVLLVIPSLSFANQLVIPAYQATLPRIVEGDNLPPANSLFATAAQGLNAVFNALSGLLIAVTGAVVLFVIDSITFFVAAILLALPTISPVENEDDRKESERSYFDDLREGITYLRGSLVLRIVAAATVTNFGYGAVMAALPEFADSLGGPVTFGLLMAAVATGSLVGSLGASVTGDMSFGRFLILGYLFTGLSVFLAVILPGRMLTIGFIFVASVPMGAYAVLTISMMQSVIADELLGRVMATTQSMYNVMIPVGSILGGVFAAVFTPSSMLYVLASLYVISAIYFLVHPELRSLPRISKIDEATLNLEAIS